MQMMAAFSFSSIGRGKTVSGYGVCLAPAAEAIAFMRADGAFEDWAWFSTHSILADRDDGPRWPMAIRNR
jgi:hypothetical protein